MFRPLFTINLQTLYEIKGKGFTPRTVKRWIKEKRLEEGRHYIKSRGVTGEIRVNLKEFNNFLDGHLSKVVD